MNTNTRNGSLGRPTVGGLAVALTVVLLSALLIIQQFGGRLGDSAAARRVRAVSIDAVLKSGSESYFTGVREAIEMIPYRVGPYLGADTEVTQAAMQLLRPNKILQRQYIDPATGKSVGLIVVHCGDVRDMQGHYPPVCYPAHGWRQSETALTSVTFDGQAFPATRYVFSRTQQGATMHLRVLNFFILPDGRVLPDDSQLDRLSKSRVGAGLGSAQVQLLFSESMTVEEQSALAEQFARVVAPVVRAVVKGVRE